MEEKKIHRFIIDTKLPSLNEYTKLNRTNYRAGNRMKAECQSYIRGCIYYYLKTLKIRNPVIIHTTWIENNKRRDLDNIRFAVKFILDALVETGTIENDSQKYVKGFTDKFEYKQKASIIVELEEIEEKEKEKIKKKCVRCKEEKEENDFRAIKRKDKIVLSSWCKQCQNEYQKRYRKINNRY